MHVMYSAPVITSVFCQLLCPLSSTSLLGLPNVPKALTFWTFTEETSRYIAKMMLLNNYRSSVAILEQLVILEGQYCQPYVHMFSRFVWKGYRSSGPYKI